jgi:hypothetical protein
MLFSLLMARSRHSSLKSHGALGTLKVVYVDSMSLHDFAHFEALITALATVGLKFCHDLCTLNKLRADVSVVGNG